MLKKKSPDTAENKEEFLNVKTICLCEHFLRIWTPVYWSSRVMICCHFWKESLSVLLQNPLSPTYLSWLKYQQRDQAMCEPLCVFTHLCMFASMCISGRQDRLDKLCIKYGSNLAPCPPPPFTPLPPAGPLPQCFPRAVLSDGGWGGFELD